MTNLQYLRLKRGLSQRQLAEQLDIHPTVLNRVERGWLAKPPAGVAEALQEFFGREWTFDRLIAEPPEPRLDVA